MGEAFKRARAAAFEHQRNEGKQELLSVDLFRVSRRATNAEEIRTTLHSHSGGLGVGARCLLMPSGGGGYNVVHGNTVVGTLPPEAARRAASVASEGPSLRGMLPCEVARSGPFGLYTLRPIAPESTDG